MLSSQVKFSDGQTDTVKQYAPNLSMRGYENTSNRQNYLKLFDHDQNTICAPLLAKEYIYEVSLKLAH